VTRLSIVVPRNDDREEAVMQSARKIAVTGATGRVGRHVVDVLEAQGHDVVRISRSSGVDLITGEGLAAALAGVESVVDAATQPLNDQDAATAFFTTSAHNLQEAGAAAGVQRIVAVSIVGADRLTGGFIAASAVHERVMSEGPIPVQILRATQFHEFVPSMLEWGRQGDVIYVPRMRTQLVAARSVAEALAGLATASGSGPEPDGGAVPEIGGPREERLAEIARLLVSRGGESLRVEEVSDSADPDHELLENGALLPGPDATLAGPTFEEWLDAGGATRVPVRAGGSSG
jgi:uncharacterized protein YbjT (DUF2867 family)